MGTMTAKVTYALELTKSELRLIGLSLQGLLKRPEDVHAAADLGVKLLREQLQAVDIQREAVANALNVAEKEPT